MAGVKVFGFAVSTWTRTARMTCIEKGIEHEFLPIPYGSEEHRAKHPFRRIPVLEVDGETIIETLAIAGFLDEAFPGGPLQPQGVAERTKMRTWMAICADYVYRDVVRAIPRDKAPSEEQLSGARDALLAAEGLMADTPYLAGPSLTLADLYLAPQLANCREKAPALLDGLAALEGWAARVSDRDSFQLTRPDART